MTAAEPPDQPPDQPPDRADRQRIRTALDTNLFVEAGAGAGKTSSLVSRIVALVADGVEIGSIAAITFTEKAAADLRHRLRAELAAAAGTASDLFGHDRFEAALDGLDHAPIGTLHAFARRLLNEFPIAAGLPPGFDVLDELESEIAFTERWDELLDRLLDDPAPAGGAAAGGVALVEWCEFDNFGMHRGFRRVGNDFHANWDLVEARVELAPPPDWQPDTTRLAELLGVVAVTATPPGDKQAGWCRVAGEWATELAAAATTLSGVLATAQAVTKLSKSGRFGAKTNWRTFGGDDVLDDLRRREADAGAEAERLLTSAREHRRLLVGAVLGNWVLESARLRASDGALEFHDLLVLARRLLSTQPDVRRALHKRFTRLLLDEFQDTDPIQLEIAVRLAADPDHEAQTGDWTELQPLPGRLFIVGDPKQSIYRFRRADIAQYLRAAAQVGAEPASLTANFRSSEPVIRWVNHVFANLIEFEPDTQPAYQPLEACRPHHLEHGSVQVFGDDHADLAGQRAYAEELRWREAAGAADAVATALHQRWMVTDESDAAGGGLRECRPGDITILLPARTSLASLEAALVARDIPYRAENSSVVYTTPEVRNLMLALRAADDATDELALVAALRTALYGCSDVELYEWKRGGGSWSIWRPPPPELTHHPVAAAIADIRSLAERSSSMAPADLLAALVDERRLLDAALDAPDARDVWRRVRYVVEQARAWSDAGGHGLRRYLAWVRVQATESRTADTILPEHDYDAVRIMTIHAAKGLEFPITVVTGLTTTPKGRSTNSVVWPDSTWTIATRHGDNVYEDFKPLDEQMSDAERRRLLYVACTRAVDHLVVSLHRVSPKVEPAPNRKPSAALLAASGATDAEAGATPLAVDAGGFSVTHPTPEQLDWSDAAVWEVERERALLAAARRATVSATTLAEDLAAFDDAGAAADEGLRKDAVDLDLPPWQRGRYGTSIGRAVHGTLQFCDFATGADIAALAAAQCAAEGIIGFETQVEALSRSALAAPVLQAAVAAEHHRELFVAAPVGDRVLEGYVDLLVRTPDGYLIVDYKTDEFRSGAVRAERIARYRRQLAAYAVALEQVLGEPVVGGVLVHCHLSGPAEQIELTAWPAALAEVRAALQPVGS